MKTIIPQLLPAVNNKGPEDTDFVMFQVMREKLKRDYEVGGSSVRDALVRLIDRGLEEHHAAEMGQPARVVFDQADIQRAENAAMEALAKISVATNDPMKSREIKTRAIARAVLGAVGEVEQDA